MLLAAAALTGAADQPPGELPSAALPQPPVVRLGPFQEQQGTKSEGDHQSGYNDYKGSQGEPLFIKVVPTPKTEEEPAEDQKKGDEKSSSDWWVVKLTAGLLLVGAAQTYVFGLQAIRLRQTIVKMDEVARDASKIGRAQVKAYVTVADVTIEIKKLLIGGCFVDEPIFRVTINNTGNSPALEFQFREETTYMYIDPSNLMRGGRTFFRHKGVGRNIPTGKTVIEHTSLDSRMNPADAEKFRSGELNMVATFHYTFEDVFGNVVTDENSFSVKFSLDTLRVEHLMKVHSINAATTASILKMAPLVTAEQKGAPPTEECDG